MKITCQSCQSKYTIADEKISGKVAKIRCRKCGETIEVDGTRLGAEEQVAAQPAAVQPEASAPAYEAVWTVNIADDDQRTMTLPEIVEAYHSGLITAETYLWAEGMSDWAPLAEVPEVVAALGSGAPPAADDAEPVRDSMFQAPPSYGDVPADATDAGDPHVSDSVRPQAAPTSTPRPLGARDEQSVLFSLSALTASAPKISVPPSSTGPTEDSGLIDLNALAAKAQEAEGTVEKTTPVPMLFPAALGSVEPVTTPAQPPPPASSSKAPIFIGAGIAIAGVAIAAVLALRSSDPPPAPTPAATAPVATQEATPAPAPTPAPTATQAEEPKAPEPAASAAPAASAEEPEPAKKPTTTTSTKKPTTKPATTKPSSKEPAKPASTGTSKPASTPKKSNCGCAPTDLQCQIRCSAMGK